MAKIPPVRGSIATIAPRLPDKARLAIICNSISKVNVRSLPGTGGV